MSDKPKTISLLAIGAHPDDIEFGCGAVIAQETSAGRSAHFVICSKGEAGTNGTPDQRVGEATESARILGASLEFVEFDGDAHLELRISHAIQIAEIIRRIKPSIVLAPSPAENQHPDHWRLARLVRDATRLARYGGIEELSGSPAHAIDQLLFFAIGPEGEMRDMPLVVDVSEPRIIETWKRSMEAHASQMKTRNYLDLALTRARTLGLRAGVEYAMALYPNDPLMVNSLNQICKSARSF